MQKTLYKIILTVILVCSAVTAAWADGWKLSGTTVYGAGGYWENGQKTRVEIFVSTIGKYNPYKN